MTTSEQYTNHASWLRNEAIDYRRKASEPDLDAYWRDLWLKRADKYEEDAIWFEDHSRMMERIYG